MIKSSKALIVLLVLTQLIFKEGIAQPQFDNNSPVAKLANAISNANSTETVILKADQPWEAGGLVYYSVFQQDSLIRLYYLCDDTSRRRHLCYAYSTDGINFTKPNLNLVQFNGNKQNNILNVLLDGACFFYDSASPEPYKILGMNGNHKIHYAYSKDGINFKLHLDSLVDYFADTQNQIIYDPTQKKYKYYLRSYQYDDRIKTPYQKHYYYRAVAYYESKQLEDIRIHGNPERHPEGGKFSIISKEFPTIIDFDRSSKVEDDIYKPSVVRYGDGLYMAYPSIFHHYPKKNDGFNSVSLYISNDGENFRLFKSDLIKEEPHSYYMAPGYALKDNVVYNYYWKTLTTHTAAKRVSEYVVRAYKLSPEDAGLIK